MISQPDFRAASLLPDERVDEVNENLRLIQKKNGLTFGTDAYLLAAFIRPQPSARAVDLGSGTGVIPLLLTAKNKIASVAFCLLKPNFILLAFMLIPPLYHAWQAFQGGNPVKCKIFV